MDREAAFKSRITEPLEAIVGKALVSVDYWILDLDRADFSEEQPNLSGVMAVSLRFGNSKVEIAPGWEKPLRADGIYHHIQVFQADAPGSVESAGAGNLYRLFSVQSAPWREVVGEPLTRVEVLGWQGSPQAICFHFARISVFVAAGYSGESDSVAGDGDELLIFSGQEWRSQMSRQISRHDQVWERLWIAASGIDEPLLV